MEKKWLLKVNKIQPITKTICQLAPLNSRRSFAVSVLTTSCVARNPDNYREHPRSRAIAPAQPAARDMQRLLRIFNSRLSNSEFAIHVN